jgi:hypothetical protein
MASTSNEAKAIGDRELGIILAYARTSSKYTLKKINHYA